ncbi:MarR family transcriptional regulator [Halobacteria archaeon AArc-curdl1]|uniref:MarR family transcriptional regulator n=1 Tax=Natronosalvus hydrolyticus TaxID=2979988 RepID=A0AAP3E6Z8_9EURY|nr:MarR family transcriptional regulator [Halobacteria archaeon AArc-curdl1]
MVSNVPFETEFAIVSTTLSDAGSVSASYLHAHAIVVGTSLSRIRDPPGGISWLHFLGSGWDVALIAVLFLLISGLVGLRIRAVATKREVEDRVQSLVPEADDESAQTTHSQTTTHQEFEQYLSPDTPPELLSDEGKVVRLLVENHGQIRQHQITEETGWSKSKVSRICSQMHEDETIEKQSVGRENVITLSEIRGTITDDGLASEAVEHPLP